MSPVGKYIPSSGQFGYGRARIPLRSLIIQVAAQLSYGTPQLTYQTSAARFGTSFAGLSGYLKGDTAKRVPGLSTLSGNQRPDPAMMVSRGYGGYSVGSTVAAAKAYFRSPQSGSLRLWEVIDGNGGWSPISLGLATPPPGDNPNTRWSWQFQDGGKKVGSAEPIRRYNGLAQECFRKGYEELSRAFEDSDGGLEFLKKPSGS